MIEGTNFALSCASILFQLTRLEIENYNQQIEMETNLEMNQHLQVRKDICSWLDFQTLICLDRRFSVDGRKRGIGKF